MSQSNAIACRILDTEAQDHYYMHMKQYIHASVSEDHTAVSLWRGSDRRKEREFVQRIRIWDDAQPAI